MAEITAALVQKLRSMTDLPMMLCKKALVEAEGDIDRAVEILKRQVGKVHTDRAQNVTAEGRVFTRVKSGCAEAAMVEVQCESAPVGSGEDMRKFGEMLVEQLLEGPGASTPEALLAQNAPGGSKPLSEIFDEMVNKIREKIVVSRVARVRGPVDAYVHHDGKTGVLFQAQGKDGCDPILRDVAMHIAALKPTVATEGEVDRDLVRAERERLTAEAKASGKPDNIIEKIVAGRMKTWYVEQGVLVMQPFAKDDSKTVSQALAERGLTAEGFVLWKIGG
ncbi:MAG: translation elongation factor Ts [Planctomycetaceae bacterium]